MIVGIIALERLDGSHLIKPNNYESNPGWLYSWETDITKTKQPCARCKADPETGLKWHQGIKGPCGITDSSMGDLCEYCFKVYEEELRVVGLLLLRIPPNLAFGKKLKQLKKAVLLQKCPWWRS